MTLVSEDPVFAGKLKDEIRESLDFVQITYFTSEDHFKVDFPETKSDIILSDQRNHSAGWQTFLEDVLKHDSDSLVIFIIEENEREKSVEMIKAGAYDVLTPASLSRIQALIHRIIRDIKDKANLRYLSAEKSFSDHIADNSRSMLSIINRDYVYEKVNATFCNAQSNEIESIIGKSLSEMWGKETFESKIKEEY